MTDPQQSGDLEPGTGAVDATDDRDEPVEDGHALQLRGRRLTNRLFQLMRYGAPACAACAFVLVMGDSGRELDDDLHLFVPMTLSAADVSVPLRALHYARLREPEGPVLLRDAIDVRIERSDARVIASGRLEPSRGSLPDLEANLALREPLVAGEDLRVIAEAQQLERPLSVRASVRVLARTEGVLPEGRPLRGLQQFSAGPVEPELGALPPSSVSVQVSGGACVPEQRCHLLVHIGTPAAALRVLPNSTLTPATLRPSAETSMVVEVDVTTHGPEAELWLALERSGQRVARRNVRLPIAMAALNVEWNHAELLAGALPLKVHSPAADGGCIVDAFRDGAWRATGSIADCAQPHALPLTLTPGLWRLQLRRDPLSMQTAGVAVIALSRPAPDPQAQADALAVLLAAARRSAPEDPLARACSDQPEACGSAAAQRYLAALLETGLVPLPTARTGFADSVARVRAQRARMRTIALIALLLGGTGLALSIGHSGVRAGQRVSLLLEGDPGAARRARLRSLLLVVASAGSLVLVFSVLALYVVARGGY